MTQGFFITCWLVFFKACNYNMFGYSLLKHAFQKCNGYFVTTSLICFYKNNGAHLFLTRNVLLYGNSSPHTQHSHCLFHKNLERVLIVNIPYT